MKKDKMNKKAVSAVVATLLLVVITIVATLLVWQVVKTQVIDKELESASCFEYRNYVRILDTDYTCYDASSPVKTQIQIERSTEEKNIEGISVTISGGATSKSYELKNGDVPGVSMFPSGEITIPNRGESKTYIFSGIAGNLASITVIINGKTCDQIRENYKIESC
jgi:flagellin-like protein